MPPEIVVDLVTELLDNDILPMLHNRESDSDVPPSPALAVMEVDVAIREISKLLLQIPSAQPPVSEAAELEPGPSSVCPQRPQLGW